MSKKFENLYSIFENNFYKFMKSTSEITAINSEQKLQDAIKKLKSISNNKAKFIPIKNQNVLSTEMKILFDIARVIIMHRVNHNISKTPIIQNYFKDDSSSNINFKFSLNSYNNAHGMWDHSKDTMYFYLYSMLNFYCDISKLKNVKELGESQLKSGVPSDKTKKLSEEFDNEKKITHFLVGVQQEVKVCIM